MRRWFASLPLHRKLVAVALLATTVTLVTATVGLTAIDVWRYRLALVNETVSLANIIAKNTEAAMVFQDRSEAERTLSALLVLPTIRQACIYQPDGQLFAQFVQAGEAPCSAERGTAFGWGRVTGAAAISRNGEVLGAVRVERDPGDLWPRLVATALIDIVLLAGVGVLAVIIAGRMHRTITEPIARLAAAARQIQPDTVAPSLPAVGDGEVGDLARALSGMLERVAEANDQLRRREAEREDLLAREREASRLKDEFLAAMSHELRTPLNAIVGWSHILNSSPVTDETMKKGLGSIERNARAQARLIEDLVDVSRIVSGKLVLRTAIVDLREVVTGAADTIRSATRAKQQQLDVELPDSPCLVIGDRDRLQQVVSNLLSNATKFTPDGGSVAVAVRRADTDWAVDVRDTGAGIKPSFLPFVFDRFRQADGSMTREHGGLGLGLAIVKELTELHGGSVEASSAGPGRGATFTVRLRAAEALPATVTMPEQHVDTRPARVLTGVHVLVTDDNVDAVESLAAALESAGATVSVATSGAMAVSEWDRRPADLLLCDLAMPGMDGFEVVQRIRERDVRAGRETRAIAVTAHATADHTARSLKAGFAAFVTKPFHFPDLLETIVGVLAVKPPAGGVLP